MRTPILHRALGLVGLLLLACPLILFAQTQITGRVVSEKDNAPLSGITVLVKGTTTGTATDLEGKFSLPAKAGDVLVISGVGITDTEVTATTGEMLIVVQTTANSLNEVVVTALGIRREKRKLGYAIQEVKGEDLTVARESNVVNQLAGKVAGVTVVGSPSGIGGSARVTIRGERSLDLNNNQPLYVIDGVPISNALQGGSGRGNLEVDFGNGASFINPDDIESMSVLKGPAASALYGSRASNGVILIKTKSGKSQKGIGVEYSSNVTAESALKLPKYQTVYGQGNGNGGDFAFVNGAGAGLTDGTDEGWGPAFRGQLYPQFNSPRTLNGQPTEYLGGDLNAPEGSVITPTPWVADKNNLRDFLQTGRAITNNIALVGGNDKGDFRLSYTNLNQTGIVPNTDLRRNTVSLSGGYNLTDKLTARAFVSYIKSESDNRPSISYGTESLMYLFNCWLPASVNVDAMKRLYMIGAEDRRQFSWNYNYHDNPYLTVMENTNGQYYNRIIGNVTLNYKFTDWLNLQLRSATDWSQERREYKRAFSTQRFPFGQYRLVNITNEERNSDFLFTANKEFGDFTVSGTFGGNQMRQSSRTLENVAGQLNIPDIYRLTNSRIPLVSDDYFAESRVNSLYGSVSVGYKDFLFLDITDRNDWNSSLVLPEYLKNVGVEDFSYNYYSVALSAILSEVVKLPSAISFLKVRGSFAQVGNATAPYTFTQAYNPSTPYGSSQIYGETDQLANLSLKPEISSALEFGTDIRFLDNRIGLDLTYYHSRTINQILRIPLSITSGYNNTVINAGLIKNWGFEAMLNLVPVKTAKFSWTVDINWSSNRSRVEELSDGLTNYVQASRGVSVEARVGERMGNLYGVGFVRVQSSDKDAPYYDATGQYAGQMVYGSNGRPLRTTNLIPLGNYNPDWLMGFRNSITYKNVRLSFLFDVRKGGELYSLTQVVGREGGIITETLEGRADGYDLSQPGNGVIGEGVIQNTDGSFAPNTTKVTAREWHTAWTGGRNIAEGVMYDASFIKLRELQIGFNIPNKVWGKLPFRNASVTLVGRNLFLWDRVPHVDPEVMSYSGGTALPGIEYMSIPSTRSYGVNLSFRL